MKRFGKGVMGVGAVAFGWALSLGIVSIGTNAVGWIAIGVNAFGFVAIGVNAVGVFSFGGVNAIGGWGFGGVNRIMSGAFGSGLSVAATLALLVARIRTWPRDETTGVVALAVAADVEGSWARARFVDGVGGVTLRDHDTELRVRLGEQAVARRATLGRAQAVRVRLRRVADSDMKGGYRDASAMIVEVVDIVAEQRALWLRTNFGDAIGIQLAVSCGGLVAALVSLFLWE